MRLDLIKAESLERLMESGSVARDPGPGPGGAAPPPSRHAGQRAALLAASFAGATGARAEDARKPLRCCADPTNLPFSSSAPGEPGLYVEIGRLLARSMGRKAEPVWPLSH